MAGLAAGRTPWDNVLIMPDWNGKAVAGLGLSDLTREHAIAVVDAAGDVLGRHQGSGAAEAAIALLETA